MTSTVIPSPRFVPASADDIAGIIRSQVPTPIWWEIGARDFHHFADALRFRLKAANNRLRVVLIKLDTAADLYSVTVCPSSPRSREGMYMLRGVSVGQLVGILRMLCEEPRRDLLAAGWEDLAALFTEPVVVIAETARVDLETGETTPAATIAAPARKRPARAAVVAPAPAAPAAFEWPQAVTPARPGWSLSRQLDRALVESGVPAIVMHTADRGGRLYYSTPAGELTPGELADRLIVGGAAAALA